MGPKGHSPSGSRQEAGHEVLLQEPNPHYEDGAGRQGKNGENEEEKLEPHLIPGEYQHIKGADAGNGPRGSDEGNSGVGGRQVLAQDGPEPTGEISDKEGPLSQPVFHVVPKYIKKVHVAKEVGQSRVEEHGGEDVLEMGMGGDEPMPPNNTLKGRLKGGLEEDVNIEGDEGQVDQGEFAGRTAFFNRENEEQGSTVFLKFCSCSCHPGKPFRLDGNVHGSDGVGLPARNSPDPRYLGPAGRAQAFRADLVLEHPKTHALDKQQTARGTIGVLGRSHFPRTVAGINVP